MLPPRVLSSDTSQSYLIRIVPMNSVILNLDTRLTWKRLTIAKGTSNLNFELLFWFSEMCSTRFEIFRYHAGLLSVEYIWRAVKQINNEIDVYDFHCNDLESIGLDLTSCVQLLIELYTQWIYQVQF